MERDLIAIKRILTGVDHLRVTRVAVRTFSEQASETQ